MSDSDSALKPRLCHMKKWSTFNGYGFNLHTDKSRWGQYIGKVDPGSPAEVAGLKEGDRIIEVNGTNIGNENHSQVVERIKAVPNETKLLVVDRATDDHFKEQKVVIRGDMPYVEKIECPDEQGGEPIRSTGSEEEVGESPFVADDVSDDSEDDIREFPPEDSLPPDAPAPRHCHLQMWPDFQGYGFNLHAEKGVRGQYIGKVDEGGPADAAGLRQGDRILEVNGQYVDEDNHSAVVNKIKQNPTKTTLLVVDEETEKFYSARNIKVNSSMPQVKDIYCPASKAEFTANGNAAQTEAEVNHSQVNGMSEGDEAAAAIEASIREAEAEVAKQDEAPTSPKGPVVVGGIEFAGSAKEARERLTKRSTRKHEVKKQEVSMRDKYELFQKL